MPSMTPRIACILFLLLLATAVTVYEAVAYRLWGLDGTITYIIRGFYADYPVIAPMIAVGFGILFRHLFPSAGPPVGPLDKP